MSDSRDLAGMRTGWDRVEAFEASLARPKTVMESVSEYLQLRRTFAYQLEQTEQFFSEERRDSLVELQQRLLLIGRTARDGHPAARCEGCSGET